MYIRCILNKLENIKIKANNYPKQFEQEQEISIGKNYLVIGINYFVRDDFYGNGMYVQILNDNDLWRLLPIDFFEITEGSLSQFWKIKNISDNEIALMPDDFYKEFYFDDLTEMVPDIVNNFRKNYKIIENEFSEIKL